MSPRRPPAADTDPVGLARLHRYIAEYLATRHPGTRWSPLPVDGSGDRVTDHVNGPDELRPPADRPSPHRILPDDDERVDGA